MENGRCSCGLLRAYPLLREFPRPGGGRAEWVGARGPPLPHARCGAEPGLPAHCWASPFANPLPCRKPYGWESRSGARPCRVPVFPCSRQEQGAPGQVHEHWGAKMWGLPSPCSCLTLPFPGPSPLQQLLHFPLFLLPGTFRLFRVQCSERGVWLSSHQATGRNTDEKLAQRETGCLCRSWGGAPNPV